MEPFCNTTRGLVTKIGSGQTQGKLTRRPFPAVFDDGDRLEVKGASWT
eukprot:COSAG06_NODE_71868_length_178_cov_37.911392_1_plen_47_part_01